ncbi:uncharacterized protein LOC103675831 isoform X2 [Ursus maritimus]|uniref:Uncharacterized protein LOC103675831 isoform X2 n=1 Tax=Ursus maritimus TaxID=29073 RepID=A0A384D800_URSMA|nr:uncharacterized protein LOC103675831 isoform X2 [Ursus maritimus]
MEAALCLGLARANAGCEVENGASTSSPHPRNPGAPFLGLQTELMGLSLCGPNWGRSRALEEKALSEPDLPILNISYTWNHRIDGGRDWLLSFGLMRSRFIHVAAGCFMKQTLRRRDGDKDVPFPATMELPLPHSQLRQPLHYSLPGPGGRGAEGTGQKQRHDPGNSVSTEDLLLPAKLDLRVKKCTLSCEKT